VQVDTNATDDPEAALIDQISEKTRLLAISTVHFATGLRLDLQRLSDACQSSGVLLCLDAIQSLGAIRLDLQATPADFVIADGHKWMLGPEGLAVFYVNPNIREKLKLTQFGWAMRQDPGDYSPGAWEPAHSAKRFEAGSPNMLGIHALHASLGLQRQIGSEEIEKMLRKNIGLLRTSLNSVEKLKLRTPSDSSRSAGILSMRVDGIESDVLWKRLMEKRVICASRGGFLRLSPHFYTRKQVLDRASAIIQQVIQDIR
jgi:selenocysteine lyase/cysteine desulfurase